ncbi:MAG TPA: thioredoxin family protein [Usitatibacter sp.]|nr:thioredoxin family protein [Usitatibacter sp.]
MNPKRFLAIVLAAAALPLSAAAPVYPEISRADADIKAALADASRTHKRVLLDFGGNWCTDCKVLDAYMRRPENAAILDSRFVVVHVNVGDKGITDNFDVAMRYGIPLKKGVPAFAVLESDGKIVYSQKTGEFESMRSMDPKSVNEFLVKWQGK